MQSSDVAVRSGDFSLVLGMPRSELEPGGAVFDSPLSVLGPAVPHSVCVSPAVSVWVHLCLTVSVLGSAVSVLCLCESTCVSQCQCWAQLCLTVSVQGSAVSILGSPVSHSVYMSSPLSHSIYMSSPVSHGAALCSQMPGVICPTSPAPGWWADTPCWRGWISCFTCCTPALPSPSAPSWGSSWPGAKPPGCCECPQQGQEPAQGGDSSSPAARQGWAVQLGLSQRVRNEMSPENRWGLE